MKRILISMILCIGVSINVSAQGITTISGTVTDANNQPVAGHEVFITNDTNFFSGYVQSAVTTTDVNGKYTFIVPTSTLQGNSQQSNLKVVDLTTRTCPSAGGQGWEYKRLFFTSSSVQSDFQICTPLSSTVSMRGWVFTYDNVQKRYNGAKGAVVYLIEKCPDPVNNSYTLSLIDTVLTDTSGMYQYQYPSISQGCELLVKAAFLPSSPDYKKYLPSYNAYRSILISSSLSSLKWSGAVHVLPFWGVSNSSVVLQAGNNPGGPAFIGGSVLQGANKSTAPGDPLKARIILLTDMNDNPVDYTYSDASGQFGFNVPYGSYKLFGDAWGKDNPALIVNVDANHAHVSNIRFHENSKEFKGEFTTGIAGINGKMAELSLYPNPVTDRVFINGSEQIDGEKTIVMTNVSGKVLFTNTYEGHKKIQISTVDLAPGIYLVHLKTKTGSAIFKLVK